jgi:hypothetical protein
LNLWIVFSSIVILTMLICGFMSMGELSTFWCLFQFLSLKKSLVFFIKFISRYFIFFWSYCKWIIALVAFSVCSLLVYRKATDFSLLILYPATLPKVFLISKSF